MANPLTMFRGPGLGAHRFDFKMKWRGRGRERRVRSINVYNSVAPFGRPLSPKWNVFPKPERLVMGRVTRISPPLPSSSLNDRRSCPAPDSNCSLSIPPRSRPPCPATCCLFLQTSPPHQHFQDFSFNCHQRELFVFFFF